MGVFTWLNSILGRETWPPPAHRRVWEEVELYSALRRSDEGRLRQERSIPWQANYLLSPAPRMLSRASANMLFGELPTFGPASENDGDALEELVQLNALDSELHRAALMASSEGEVWGRVTVAPDVVEVPMVEFWSRGAVIPHFAGRFVVGATFITTWETSATERLRLFETYGPGFVESQVYRGTAISVGTKIALDGFQATKGLQEVVETGLDFAAVAFIPNSFDADPQRGYSDYRGLEARFFALNEATTIGQENMRLAGKKRALVDAEYLDREGELGRDADLLVRHARQQQLGDGSKPLEVLEYDSGAEATIAWLDHLIDSSLTLAGYSPASVGRGDVGQALSGTAMKLRMNHSLLEQSGKGRHFDRGVQRLLRAAQLLDRSQFGRAWAKPDEEPSITRGDGLPFDSVEEARVIAELDTAKAISLEQKVRRANPDMSEDEIADELAAIEDEREAAAEVGRPTIPAFRTEPPEPTPRVGAGAPGAE